MSAESSKTVDWVHLPPGSQVLPLWAALHDGDMISCSSSVLEREIEIGFELNHPSESEGVYGVTLRFHAVTSARVNISVRWPGPFHVPSGTSRLESEKLVAEYQSKWREESLGWAQFESGIGANFVAIANGEIAQGTSQSTIKIQGHLDGDDFDDAFCELYVCFECLTIEDSTGNSMSLGQFLEIGESYWSRGGGAKEAKG